MFGRGTDLHTLIFTIEGTNFGRERVAGVPRRVYVAAF